MRSGEARRAPTMETAVLRRLPRIPAGDGRLQAQPVFRNSFHIASRHGSVCGLPGMSNKLYSIRMKRLGDLLSSAARTELLRVLVCQPGAVGLRPAARLAGIHPHSAELALAGLIGDKLVKRRTGSAGPAYELNRRHADLPVLEAVFAAAAQAGIAARRPSLQLRARRILPFIRQATRMLAHARETRHVA